MLHCLLLQLMYEVQYIAISSMLYICTVCNILHCLLLQLIYEVQYVAPSNVLYLHRLQYIARSIIAIVCCVRCTGRDLQRTVILVAAATFPLGQALCIS